MKFPPGLIYLDEDDRFLFVTAKEAREELAAALEDHSGGTAHESLLEDLGAAIQKCDDVLAGLELMAGEAAGGHELPTHTG